MPCLGQEKATQDAIREKEAEAQRREAQEEAQRRRREAEAENEAQRQDPERQQVRQQQKARKQPQMTNGAEESVKKFSEEVAAIVARCYASNAHDSTRVTSKDHPLLISVALHREGLFATLNSHQVCVCVSVSCARAKP